MSKGARPIAASPFCFIPRRVVRITISEESAHPAWPGAICNGRRGGLSGGCRFGRPLAGAFPRWGLQASAPGPLSKAPRLQPPASKNRLAMVRLIETAPPRAIARPGHLPMCLGRRARGFPKNSPLNTLPFAKRASHGDHRPHNRKDKSAKTQRCAPPDPGGRKPFAGMTFFW